MGLGFGFRESLTHRHTPGVGHGNLITAVCEIHRVVPAAEEAYAKSRSGRGIDLAATERGKNLFAGVLRCPHGGQTGNTPELGRCAEYR